MATQFEVLQRRTSRYLRKLEPVAEKIRKQGFTPAQIYAEASILTVVSILRRMKNGEIDSSKCEPLMRVLTACAHDILKYNGLAETATEFVSLASPDWKPLWYDVIII